MKSATASTEKEVDVDRQAGVRIDDEEMADEVLLKYAVSGDDEDMIQSSEEAEHNCSDC